MRVLAPIDELRELPPPLQLLVLEEIAREHGPAAVAALRWQVEAHRRPADGPSGPGQWMPASIDELPTILVITSSDYGAGKTQLATWILLRAILDWRVEGPRVIAATKEAVRETVVGGRAGLPGLLSWLPPWVPRSWQSSTGYAGLLTVDGAEVSCLSADAGANAIGSGAGLVLFDDYAKCVQVLGVARAEAALEAAFKSLRLWPGKMLLPTTPDGAEFVLDLAREQGMRGVQVLDIGGAEANRGNLAAGYLDDIMPNLRALGRLDAGKGGAFAHVPWAALRVRERDVPRLKRAIVFVDPNKSQRDHACKVGIVSTGIDVRGIVYGLGNRSAVRPPEGPDGWPVAALDLAEEIEDRHGLPRGSVELGIEMNTPGKTGPAVLRAEQQLRSVARGGAAVAPRKIHEITSRPGDPKAKRAEPIVNLCGSVDGTGSQVRMVVGLGDVERSLSGLTDAGRGSDEADAFVHGVLILTGLGDRKASESAAERQRAAEETRAAFADLVDGQAAIRRPAFDLDVA